MTHYVITLFDLQIYRYDLYITYKTIFVFDFRI